MKILMTSDTVGGVWAYSLELARALEPHGVDVVLATMGDAPSGEQRRQARCCRNVELAPSTYKLEWMQNPWRDVDGAGEWLLALEQRHAPHVVHLNGYAHGALTWRAPLLIGAHSCVRSWWRAVNGAASVIPPEWDEYTRRVRNGLVGADLVVAPTYAMLAALDDHYGPVRESQVIPNGRDARRFVPGTKEALILSAGRLWDEAKNVAILARVASSLSWPVVVAGATTSPDGTEVELSDDVRWLGSAPPGELAFWLGRASIYALPARYEPFGLSALEAALCGCALVLGDIPSLKEVWGDAALFVTPDDDEALVAAIERLVEDRVLRRALARRARARAVELSPQRMAVQYLAAYQRLCDARLPAEVLACAS